MYRDIINYELAETITEARLMEVAKQIVQDWMKQQEGFIRWEIHSNNSDTYTDIVYWQTEADAKKATEEMANIPNAKDWFGCYKEGTIKSQNVKLLQTF